MSIDTVALSFGCPRSGTTWMRKVCERMDKVLAWKLSENAPLHPCHSANGLLHLVESLHKRRLVMIRTVRNPLEIAESFAAARTKKLRSKTPGLARNSDWDVVNWIRSESDGYWLQAEDLDVIEVRYEDMGDPKKRDAVAVKVAKIIGTDEAAHFRRGLDTFGGSPARVGRLSEGIGRVLSKDQRAWYAEQLADVMEREGYA